MLKAVTRQSAKVDAKINQLNAEAAKAAAAEGRKEPNTITTGYFFDHYATPEDIAVMVTEEDFMAAHRELIPSVSAGELGHYERVRATFEGGRGESEKSRPEPLNLGGRTVSGASSGKLSAKGKGKAVKGKGKGVATGNEDDEDEDDYAFEAADGEETINGSSRRDKGKGKAVAGFQDGTASDDEGLYDE